MDSLNLEILIIIHSKLRTKLINHFENIGVWIFNQICLENVFFLNRGSFELKLSFSSVINSIMGIKIWNLDFKIWFSPSLVSLTTSQTNET